MSVCVKFATSQFLMLGVVLSYEVIILQSFSKHVLYAGKNLLVRFFNANLSNEIRNWLSGSDSISLNKMVSILVKRCDIFFITFPILLSLKHCKHRKQILTHVLYKKVSNVKLSFKFFYIETRMKYPL